MATVMLKLDGVTGDVTLSGFTGCMEIDNVQFGMSREIRSAMNSDENREAGTPYVSGVTFTKNEDDGSPSIYSHHYNSKAFDDAEISWVRTASGGEAYRVVRLEDVIVSGLKSKTSEGGDPPVETITLNFTRIHITDHTTLKDGTNGSSETAGYDLGLGTPI